VAKVFTWTNADLDGVGSVVLLKSMFPNLEHQSVYFGDFDKKFLEWWKNNQDEYDKVFIVGIPLDQKLVNKIDDHRVVLVSDNDKPTVYDSTLIYDDVTSCTKLLYNKFKDRIDFPTDLKKFFAYINDYNSYSLKHEESKYLNAIYRRSGSNKFNKFVKRFAYGFDGFTEKEVNLAESFFTELDNELENLELYQAEFKGWKVVSTVSKFSANELAAVILENYEPDIAIVFNPDTKFVSFRKRTGSGASAALIAENLCDGGGSDFAAGGRVTEKFLEFTQKFSLV
jgi:hypothetical protein